MLTCVQKHGGVCGDSFVSPNAHLKEYRADSVSLRWYLGCISVPWIHSSQDVPQVAVLRLLRHPWQDCSVRYALRWTLVEHPSSPENSRADNSLTGSVPVKVAATEHPRQESDTIRMERRSTPTRLLPRLLRHKGSFGRSGMGVKSHWNGLYFLRLDSNKWATSAEYIWSRKPTSFSVCMSHWIRHQNFSLRIGWVKSPRLTWALRPQIWSLEGEECVYTAYPATVRSQIKIHATNTSQRQTSHHHIMSQNIQLSHLFRTQSFALHWYFSHWT